MHGYGLEVQVIIGIKNSGKGIAKAPFIAFDCSAPFKLNMYGLDGNMKKGMKRLPYIGSDL